MVIVCLGAGSQRINKGFGFVSYDSTDSSRRALESLSGRQFLGKPLNIQLKLGENLASLNNNSNNNKGCGKNAGIIFAKINNK